ncbi:MAG: alpha amylase [Acidobacteria bacterium]|nr:MAG: alpha amylase [Acidobacteriota bacterium]
MPLPDVLLRRQSSFLLWRSASSLKAPLLIIGEFAAGNPNTLANRKDIPLVGAGPTSPGLWALAASDSGLADGIYHYWFQIENTNPADPAGSTILCTDPFATAVDWRLLSPSLPAGFNDDTDRQPAAVIKLKQGKLLAVDAGGESADFPDDPPPDTLPTNNQLVIYELPTAWSRTQGSGAGERAVGSFQDTLALVDENASGANFEGLDVLDRGRSYLTELGVNALELLPPADSFFKRTWGYDTSHFLAPDWELGFPDGQISSTANADLAALVESCHRHKIRFFIDVVMAFGRNEAYQWIDFDDFYIADPKASPADPDALTSRRGGGQQELRNGFGSILFRYTRPLSKPSYDPISGQRTDLAPARALMLAYIARWMRDFRVDGVRMDSVENVANWDFIGAFKDLARSLWKERWQNAGLAPSGADERFLVIGEELSRPLAILTQGRLDALWNDGFRERIRAAILAENVGGENFEFTVRNAIDCRGLGFAALEQAVNYVTSHDVEGLHKERLFTMLSKAGFKDEALQKRIQLAFVCLLTANGIPMFLAGEEFADQNDLFDSNGNVSEAGGKQVDPVDFSRRQDAWRDAIFRYVSELVKLRTTHPALGVIDTDFIHVDFNDAKRVLAWKRGSNTQDPLVVVANFSDYQTPNGLSDPNAEYVVSNWPQTPPGREWREVTQKRKVLPQQVGREPIFSWEAKVYKLA